MSVLKKQHLVLLYFTASTLDCYSLWGLFYTTQNLLSKVARKYFLLRFIVLELKENSFQDIWIDQSFSS